MARTAPHAKEDILVAARRCFAETGFRGTSLSRIARAYGGSKSVLLYHFESKDAILRALLEPLWSQTRALASEVRDLAGAEGRDRTIDGMAELAVVFRDDLAVFHGEFPLILEYDEFKDARRAMDDIFAALLLGATEPAARMVASLLVGGVAGICHEYPDAPPDVLRDVVRGVMAASLAELPARRPTPLHETPAVPR